MRFFGIFPYRPFLKVLSIMHFAIGALAVLLVLVVIVQLSPGVRIDGLVDMADVSFYSMALSTILFMELILLRGFSSYVFSPVSILAGNSDSMKIEPGAPTGEIKARVIKNLDFMSKLKVFLAIHAFSVLTLTHIVLLSNMSNPDMLRDTFLYYIPLVFVYEVFGIVLCFPSPRQQHEYEEFIRSAI